MSGVHGSTVSRLFVPRDSRVHRLSPEAKLVAVVAVVVVIAMTPRRETAAFALYAVGAWAIIATTKIGVLTYLKRLSVIIPFVMFALIVPFIGGGESVRVLGVSLSVDGLWATWNILAKAGLGATMSIALSATTPVAELLHGMARLKVPRLLVAIIAFMLRYIDVLVERLGRMRRSMLARGHDPRWLWQVKPIASSAGALLFVLMRGERVHQAMLARGYTGVMPAVLSRGVNKEWLAVLLCPFGAALVLTVAVV